MAETPISLYFDLEPGQVADLEVIARASLAFVAATQEAAYLIDPSLDLRVELSSGTEGSLSLNAILRNLRDKKGESITLGAIALIVVSWLSHHAMDYAFEKGADLITGKEEHAKQFTAEQRKELQEIVGHALDRKVGHEQVQRFYREIERDPAIRGVGATTLHDVRPEQIVPRSEFARRAGQGVPSIQTVNRRVTTERVRLILISPVLLPGNRRWKFRSTQGEFGAAIKDSEFTNRVLSGTTAVRMKAGIEMMVDLETIEEFRHGVWEVIERNVTHVDRLIEPPTQGDLLFPSGDDQQSPKDDSEDGYG